mmetsp:Transcript_11441/g.47927  ORF Transcript_11441/g.47927 Transcript_11441/m.47927 type:complete len:272 (-) Transcript_11441:427-1242(-)
MYVLLLLRLVVRVGRGGSPPSNRRSQGGRWDHALVFARRGGGVFVAVVEVEEDVRGVGEAGCAVCSGSGGVRRLGALGRGGGCRDRLGRPPPRLLLAPPALLLLLERLLDARLLFFAFFQLPFPVGGGAPRAVRAALGVGVGVGVGGGGVLLLLLLLRSSRGPSAGFRPGGLGRRLLDVLARRGRRRGPGRALEGHERVQRPRPPLLDALFPRANLPGEHLVVPEDDLVYLRLVGVPVPGLDRGDDFVLVEPGRVGLGVVHRGQRLGARLR